MKNLRCLVWLLPLVLVASCNKTTRYNSTFVKGQSWNVYDDEGLASADIVMSSLIINENSFDNGEEYGAAFWQHMDGSQQEVTWRFWRNASIFEVHHIGDVDQNSKASLQSYYRSGVYDVSELSKSEFTIESEATAGYQGKLIKMIIRRK